MSRIKHPSFSLLTGFILKSILLDVRTATTACFLVPYGWSIFVRPFTLKPHLCGKMRCVPYRQQTGAFYPVSLSLIGELRLLIFKVIIQICVLIVATVWLIFRIVVFSVYLSFNSYGIILLFMGSLVCSYLSST